MSTAKKKTAPPFDSVQAAVAVRGREVALETFTSEQQQQIRHELRHTGRLRTKLLRNAKPATDSGLITRTSYPNGFYSG